MLNFEFTSKELEFKDMTFPLLIAGEMEILARVDISKEERETRIKMIKTLAYHASYLEVDVLLDIYAMFIGSIEKGQLEWGSKRALERLEQSMILRTLSKQKSSKQEARALKKEKNFPRVIYCLDYNKNRCSENDSHEGKFNGQTVVKHHVCSRCLHMDNVKRAHPEGDSDCPNKAKQ